MYAWNLQASDEIRILWNWYFSVDQLTILSLNFRHNFRSR